MSSNQPQNSKENRKTASFWKEFDWWAWNCSSILAVASMLTICLGMKGCAPNLQLRCPICKFDGISASALPPLVLHTLVCGSCFTEHVKRQETSSVQQYPCGFYCAFLIVFFLISATWQGGRHSEPACQPGMPAYLELVDVCFDAICSCSLLYIVNCWHLFFGFR